MNPFPAKLVVEKDRVYIENDNKHHGNGMINPENFSPYPKNAKFFKEIGWVDELGSGVRNIYKYNKIYSGVVPEFIEGDVFKTIIPLTNQDTIQDTVQDNENIKGLLVFYRTPRTREEIQDFIGLNNSGHFRQKILNPSIKGGLIKMSLPDKPRSRNQKYYSSR